MKKILLTLLAFMTTVAVNAEQVSRQQALQKAQQFMPGKQFGEAKSFARADSPSEGEPFYVFNAEGNQGFVIVSGDDRTTEILGYSKTGNLDMTQLPENLKSWLDGYARQIEALGTSAEPAPKAKSRGAGSWDAIEPLIQTKWNQYYPYNMMCPDKNGKDWRDADFDTEHLMTEVNDQIGYHCLTGCVATAMAQVMYYWKCLDNCPAIPAYNTYSSGWTMKALEATTFEWDKMKKTYNGKETDESAEAIAKLFRYCGQAVNMDYGLYRYGGSSAGLSASVMARYFGFGKNARLVMRYKYSETDWERMIYKELSEDQPRPVFYSGSSNSGGHQFIVDGYDGNGLFHMNWGWGGMSDGYYVLSLANSDELGAGGGTSKDGYSWNQSAIIGLIPDDGEAEKPQFYAGFYGEMEENVFYRGSALEDFEDIKLPGYVLFQFDNQDIPVGEYTCTFEAGWGLYKNGSLVGVFGKSEIPSGNKYIEDNDIPFSFGRNMADGQYRFRQVYRLQDSEDWQLCETHGIVFVDAVIQGNKLTLRKSSESEYTSGVHINEVTFFPSELEVGKPVEVTVNLTNNGDSFQELICLWNGLKRETLVCGSVESGKTGTVKLHFTPENSGETYFRISTDAPANLADANVVWQKVKTISDPKPQSLSGTSVIDNFDKKHMVLSGTTLNMTVNVKNEGENSYDNAIVLELYKIVPDAELHPLIKTESVMASIEPGETNPVVFTIPDLDLDGQYFFAVYYSSAGDDKVLVLPESGWPFSLTDKALTIPGDADGNGTVGPEDITAVVKYITTGDDEGLIFENADLNGDEKVDAADLVLLINMLQ